MQFFGKTIENVRKHRNIKLVITERRRNKLLYYKVIHRKFMLFTVIKSYSQK